MGLLARVRRRNRRNFTLTDLHMEKVLWSLGLFFFFPVAIFIGWWAWLYLGIIILVAFRGTFIDQLLHLSLVRWALGGHWEYNVYRFCPRFSGDTWGREAVWERFVGETVEIYKPHKGDSVETYGSWKEWSLKGEREKEEREARWKIAELRDRISTLSIQRRFYLKESHPEVHQEINDEIGRLEEQIKVLSVNLNPIKHGRS